MKEELLNQLESNPDLDRWFTASSQDEENFTVIIEVEGKLYKWDELHGLQYLIAKPVDKSNFDI